MLIEYGKKMANGERRERSPWASKYCIVLVTKRLLAYGGRMSFLDAQNAGVAENGQKNCDCRGRGGDS